MVRGAGIAVTAVDPMYQCAETTRIARGLGTDAPNAAQDAVYRLSSSAFMGLPWPRKTAGIGESGIPVMLAAATTRLRTTCRVDGPARWRPFWGPQARSSSVIPMSAQSGPAWSTATIHHVHD